MDQDLDSKNSIVLFVSFQHSEYFLNFGLLGLFIVLQKGPADCNHEAMKRMLVLKAKCILKIKGVEKH